MTCWFIGPYNKTAKLFTGTYIGKVLTYEKTNLQEIPLVVRLGSSLVRLFEVLRMSLVLRRAGAKHGTRPALAGYVPQIQVRGRLTIGDHFSVRARQFPVQITVGIGAQLLIGDRVFLNQGVNILASQSVVIGSDCKIADLAAIRDTDTHQVDPSSPLKTAPIIIGRNVWIGRAAVIMPGVTLGENAVVAAGAIVVRDVEPNSVVAGVPASVVREFDAPTGWVRR